MPVSILFVLVMSATTDELSVEWCVKQVEDDAKKRNVTLSVKEIYQEARELLEIKRQMTASLKQTHHSSSPPSSSPLPAIQSLPPLPTNASLPSNQSINVNGSQTVNIAYMQTHDALNE